MRGFLVSIIWTIPFLVLQWLGLPWWLALLATAPIMAAIYFIYWRYVDHVAGRPD